MTSHRRFAECFRRPSDDLYDRGRQAIYNDPVFSEAERKAIAVIAESLDANIKAEPEKSLEMYEKLHSAFVGDNTT